MWKDHNCMCSNKLYYKLTKSSAQSTKVKADADYSKRLTIPVEKISTTKTKTQLQICIMSKYSSKQAPKKL